MKNEVEETLEKCSGRPMFDLNRWPKTPPVLSTEQEAAKERFMMLWHQMLPSKYSAIESFNHGWVAKLPIKKGCRTLEIGAGIGGHLKFEDLSAQEYHCIEYREEFCQELRKLLPSQQIHCGSAEAKQPWPDKYFDRLIAIHVLEHLLNLPKALEEAHRLLKDDGVFDVVLPCEGGLAYSLARKFSAKRFFEKKFKMDYTPIIRNEHVNNFKEIDWLLDRSFTVETSSFFPLLVPVPTINLVVGLRLRKKPKSAN